MAEQTTLGQLAGENARRDAIHIAVAPVTAGMDLGPGQRVFINSHGDAMLAVGEVKPTGIVDPFLAGPVMTGNRFYLCLFPGTVTGLRHVWSHPAFEPTPPAPPDLPEAGKPFDHRKAFEIALQADPYDAVTHAVFADWLDEQGEESAAAWQRAWTKERQEGEDWLRAFADRVNVTFRQAVCAGSHFINYGQAFVQYGEDGAQDELLDEKALAEYWAAWSAYTGRDPGGERRESPFACSC